jgi:ubiquitin-protein ligase
VRRHTDAGWEFLALGDARVRTVGDVRRRRAVFLYADGTEEPIPEETPLEDIPRLFPRAPIRALPDPQTAYERLLERAEKGGYRSKGILRRLFKEYAELRGVDVAAAMEEDAGCTETGFEHFPLSAAGLAGAWKQFAAQHAQNPARFPDGKHVGRVTARFVDGNPFEWDVFMKGPAGSPYEGGVFQFSFEFPQEYPFKAPTVYMKTRIYHMGFDRGGRDCGLSDGFNCGCRGVSWSPALTVGKLAWSHYISGVAFCRKIGFVVENFN